MSLKEAKCFCAPWCYTLRHFSSHSASLESRAASREAYGIQEPVSLEDSELWVVNGEHLRVESCPPSLEPLLLNMQTATDVFRYLIPWWWEKKVQECDLNTVNTVLGPCRILSLTFQDSLHVHLLHQQLAYRMSIGHRVWRISEGPKGWNAKQSLNRGRPVRLNSKLK